MSSSMCKYVSTDRERSQSGQEEKLLPIDGTASFCVYLTVMKSAIWHQL